MKNKGITLIALIITIIVMLILVMVAINVAFQENLFQRTKVAADKTQRETDKEALLTAVIGSLNNDGFIIKNNLIQNANNIGFDSEDYEEGKDFPVLCTNRKSQNKFLVEQDGKIVYLEDNSGESEQVKPQDEDIVPDTYAKKENFQMFRKYSSRSIWI